MDHEGFVRAARYWVEKDAATKHLDPAELLRRIETFVGAEGVCALATAAGDLVRCTPIEYHYHGGSFWLFSEGGRKFQALEANPHVCLAVYAPGRGFGDLESVQVTGIARLIDPDADAYATAASAQGVEADVLRRMEHPINLIEVVPTGMDYLCSALKEEGFGVRQHLDLNA